MIVQGDKVRVHYTGKLEDGTVFDSSYGKEPLEFTIGLAQMIPGFEEAVLGMEVGEKKEQKIEYPDAYGEYRQDYLYKMDREKLPKDIEMKEGLMLYFKSEEGGQFPVYVKSVEENFVTLDANHPLAGKDLYFEIEILSIN